MKSMLSALLMAFVMIPMMQSCSGDDAKSPFFGSLPKVYGEYKEAGDKLKEEAKDIKTEEEKAKYLEKSEKLQQKWAEKLETAAKKIDGKPLEFGESDIKVTTPVSFQFKDITEKSSLYVVFNFNGSAETKEDITIDRMYIGMTISVNLVGYDVENKVMFSYPVGKVQSVEKDGKIFIPAGTSVEFNTFQFGGNSLDAYINTTVLKLEVNK